MKSISSFSRKGFTLVELMIVIAIIGILAAVLYPSMTGYFERSRDTNRQGALRNISLSLAAYNSDNSKYPAEDTSDKCTDVLQTALSDASNGAKYINQLPKDPKNAWWVEGCKTPAKSGFGYKILGEATSQSNYILSANMEIKSNATAYKDRYDAVTKIEETGVFVKGKTAENGLEWDTAKIGSWYYTVAQ